MHRIVKIVVLMMSFVLITGCAQMSEQNIKYRVMKKYGTIYSLECDSVVNINSNASTNSYNTKMWYKSPDMYKLQSDDLISIVNGSSAVIKSGNMPATAVNNLNQSDMDYFYLSTFFLKYFENQVCAVQNDLIVLKAQTELKSGFRRDMELSLNKRTLQPISLTINGTDGKNSVTITYNSVKINPTLDDNIFNAEG